MSAFTEEELDELLAATSQFFISKDFFLVDRIVGNSIYLRRKHPDMPFGCPICNRRHYSRDDFAISDNGTEAYLYCKQIDKRGTVNVEARLLFTRISPQAATTSLPS